VELGDGGEEVGVGGGVVESGWWEGHCWGGCEWVVVWLVVIS
jgi:hypothetical protein